MIFLEDLPVDHAFRNLPLAELRAGRQWRGGGEWKPVTQSYAIAKCTYNDLGDAWTRHSVWRAGIPGLVVHCKVENYDVYIGRPSEYGNPHVMYSEADRQQVIDLFERTARARLAVDSAWAAKVRGLHGKVLGCWCAPRPCHGDVLLKLAAELHDLQPPNLRGTRT